MMILLVVLSLLARPAAAATLQELSRDLEAVAARAKPAVVNLRRPDAPRPAGMPVVEPRRPVDPLRARMAEAAAFFREPRDEAPGPEQRLELARRSLGSGVVVRPDGLIVTNAHVVDDLAAVEVVFGDGARARAWVVARDKATDLAAVKIEHDGKRTFAHLQLAADDDLRAGSVVVAVGNSPIIGHTVTMGIVSATGRKQIGISDLENYLQVDAAINKGNSGGPLVDARGRFVGLNSAAFSREAGFDGVGFAIPAAMVRRILDDFLRVGRAERAYLGLQLADRPDGGVVISSFTRRSGWDTGKLRRGDVVVAFDGAAVDGAAELKHRIALTRPHAKVTLGVLRGGKRLDIEVSAAPATTRLMRARFARRLLAEGDAVPKPMSYEQTIKGTVLAGLVGLDPIWEFETFPGYPAGEEGIRFEHVVPGSDAEYLGFRPGDAVLHVGDRRVRKREDLYQRLLEWGLEPLPLQLVRSGRYVNLMVPARGPRPWVEGGEPAYATVLERPKLIEPLPPHKSKRPRRSWRGRSP